MIPQGDLIEMGGEGAEGFAPACGTALSSATEPVPVSALRASIAGAESDAPLIDFLNRRMALVDSLNDAWARRRAERPKGQQRYQDRAARAHRARMAAATALRPAHDLPADDWAPCPTCQFIAVACDCGGHDFGNSPGRFGPRSDTSEARPVHAMKGL